MKFTHRKGTDISVSKVWSDDKEVCFGMEGCRMKTNLEIAKRVVEEYFQEADMGIFDCRNWAGDPMVTIYNDAGLMIDICYKYSYFEVFGLSDEDFAELKNFYILLKK